MAKARRTFTREFKVEAVRHVVDQGKGLDEVARELDLGENMLRNWKQALAAEGDRAFPGKGCQPALEEELRRLRAEVKRLRTERDILKKAAAFFAREPSRGTISSNATRGDGRSGRCAGTFASRPAAATAGEGGLRARRVRGARP